MENKMEIMIIGFRGLRILNIDKSNGKKAR